MRNDLERELNALQVRSHRERRGEWRREGERERGREGEGEEAERRDAGRDEERKRRSGMEMLDEVDPCHVLPMACVMEPMLLETKRTWCSSWSRCTHPAHLVAGRRIRSCATQARLRKVDESLNAKRTLRNTIATTLTESEEAYAQVRVGKDTRL